MRTYRVLSLIKGLGRGGAEQLLASRGPHFDRIGSTTKWRTCCPGRTHW